MAYIPKGQDIGDGRAIVSSAGTRVKLSTKSVLCYKVEITAEEDNAGVVVVGAETVTANIATRRGVYLNAGDSYTITDVNNLNKIWLDATEDGDGVTYIYYY